MNVVLRKYTLNRLAIGVVLVFTLFPALAQKTLNTPLTANNIVYNPVKITLSPGFSTTGYTFRAIIGLPYLDVTASMDKNFIMTTTYNYPSSTTNASQASDKLREVQYFDGLGRLSQTVIVQGSPQGNDIIVPNEYDSLNRECKKYLPYASDSATGSFRSTALLNQATFYSTGYPQCATDSRPFSETVFEPSPLNRPLQQYGPGQNWYSGHPVAIDYQSNIANEVLLWTISGTTVSCANNYYAPNTLYKTQTTDENGNKSWEYKDIQGRVVLKKVDSEQGTLNTYYVYNDLDQLAYVIPPKVLMGNYSEKSTIFNELIYAYHYDARGRLKEKHIPGTGWVYMVYNKIDQLVLSQDSVQRTNPTDPSKNNTWIFTKYDTQGRVIMTGKVIISNIRDTIQAVVNRETILWETRNNNLTTSYYYTANSYPQSTFSAYEPLTVNYYDTYGFDSNIPAYQQVLGNPANSSMTTGLLTGSKVKVLDGLNTWLLTVNYYDDKGRPIQAYSQKLNGTGTSIWDRLTTNYDFEGKALKTERYHNSILTITNRYTYDQVGRKKAVYQQMNSDPEVELAEYNYNELGQLVKKNIHGNNSSKLQGINYRYNIRGWLTSINNAKLNNDGILSDEDNVAFGEEMNYTNSFTAGNTTGSAQWNGNISGITWKSKGPTIPYSSINVNAYAFQYDKLNRLTLANYGSGTNITTWNDNPGRYNEAVSYDSIGNIMTLLRNGIQGTIDNLTYRYKPTSNKLAAVTDVINDPNGFNDGNKTGDDYTYDGNGNLITDLNKGLTISYNYLNLPQSVNNASQSKTITYIYDATGKKLAKSFGQPVHYYMDGIEYDGATLLFAMTEEGRIRPRSNSTYTYDYFLKDHLGNIHVVLSSDTPSLTNYPTATMETGTAALESTYYANLDATRFAKPTGFDTNSGNLNVARVNSSQQIGPSITLKVNAGDQLNLGVKSFYQSSGSNYNRNTLATTALSQLLTALLSPMALSGTTLIKATDGVNTQAFGNSTNYQTMMGSLPLSNYNSSPSNTPKAYLVWLLFDNEFNLIKTGNSSGMLQVPTGTDHLKTLAQTGITMDKSGFFYAYVVNESSMNVYFDDFQVSTTIGPVLEENNYYPFGLLNA